MYRLPMSIDDVIFCTTLKYALLGRPVCAFKNMEMKNGITIDGPPLL